MNRFLPFILCLSCLGQDIPNEVFIVNPVTKVTGEGGLAPTVNQNTHTGNNELLVNLEGHVCVDNTSTSTLAGDGVFTGDWQDTLDYGVVTISVTADQDSAMDGLVIQWSPDGSSVSSTDQFTILADNAKTFTFGPADRYVKVIYTNGATTQTSFFLSTVLRRVFVKPSSHRIQDSIVGEDDAELVKAVITGQDDNGVFQNVKTDLGALLRVNSFPYTYSISKGNVLGHTALLKFGTRTSVSANTPSVIWEGTAAMYPYMTTAQQLKVVSTSANDTATTGTGVRTLSIIGLDADYNEVSETISMNGLTAVTTSNSYLRIFRAYVVECGSLNYNDGIIYVRNNAATTVQARINAGDSQTLMTLWTVPAGKTAYLLQGTFSTDSNKGARISLFTKENDGVNFAWRIRYRAYAFSGNELFPFQIPFKIEEKTDIEVRVNTPGSAGTTSCGATFELWYENN